jgi:rubrerythrin
MDSVPHIVWHKPPAADLNFHLNANLGLHVNDAALVQAPSAIQHPSAMMKALMKTQIPLVAGANTAKEHALGLLQIAAEVEQALMVQYLYAAVSIPSSAGPPNFRRKLARIAVQEMGHLATVQNLLLLVGGADAFHLQRDVVRKTSQLNPIPFVLQPVSRITLAEYVAAEMPAEVPSELKPRVDELVALAKEKTTVALHRVGAIYAVLKWLFLPKAQAEAFLPSSFVGLPSDTHLADGDLQPPAAIKEFEALPTEWHDDAEDIILVTCHSASEAVHAIELIADQGEGLGDGLQSHFRQFLDMANDFDKGLINSVALATSPNLGTGNGAEGGETITAPYTKLWAEVFALQYGLLLLTIHHTLHIRRHDADAITRRTAIADTNIEGMKTIIRPLLGLVAGLPIHADSAALAGPPFDLDPKLLQSGSEAELAARHLKSLDALKVLYSSIEQSPDFENFPGHDSQLQDLRNFDEEKRDLLTPLVTPESA